MLKIVINILIKAIIRFLKLVTIVKLLLKLVVLVNDTYIVDTFYANNSK